MSWFEALLSNFYIKFISTTVLLFNDSYFRRSCVRHHPLITLRSQGVGGGQSSA